VTATSTPSLSATPSVTAGATPSPTASITPTITPTISNSGTPGVTPSNTPSVTASVSPSLSATPSVTATITPTISNSATPQATPDASQSATPTVTPTNSTTPSVTATTTPSLSATPSVTAGATPSPTASITPTITPTVSNSGTPDVTPSNTPSGTPAVTPTNSATPSVTATITPTVSNSGTPESTPDPSPSVTPTITPTISLSPSETPAVTPTNSATASVTPSTTQSLTPTPTPSASTTPNPPVVLDITDMQGNNASVSNNYHAQLAATGGNGTYTYSIWSGTLPVGITLDASTGVISGIPTTAGSVELGIRVDSGGQSDLELITLYVYAEALDMWFEGAVDITTDTSIEIVFHGQGGAGEPYEFVAPSVTPAAYPELVYDPVIKYIYGYIRTPGVYTIPVTVTDPVGGKATKNLVITVTEAPIPSPTPTPSLSSIPEDTSLYYVSSNVSDNVPSESTRAIDTDGFISDRKLMIRNSYFMMAPDANGNLLDTTAKIITLDEADTPDTYSVALYTPNGYDMQKIAYIVDSPTDTFVNSNLSFLPHTNQMIMTRSDVSNRTFYLDIWDMTADGKLDWSAAAADATIPPPSRTHTFTTTVAGNIVGPIHRVYVDRATDETGIGHDRIYMLTKAVSTAAGDVLVATAINKRNGDGTTTLVESTTNYISTSAGEMLGSTSQPPNPNFTVIFTIEKAGKTEKIIASRIESIFDVPMVVSDISAANLPQLNHITTSADYQTMLASSLEDNIIYSFDPYTLAYINVYGSVMDANPTTVVNYDYIRMNLIPTNSHNVWDASLTSPWAKINVINYDDVTMDMTYLHYDIHRSILRAQSWKYAPGSTTEVIGTYIGYVGIKSVIPALPTPTPTSSPLSSPTATPTQTPEPTPTQTPSRTAAITPSVSVSSSVTPTPTPSQTPTKTAPVTPTVTPSITQSVTPSITVTPSAEVTPTPSPSPIPDLLINTSGVPETAMKGLPYEGVVTSSGGPNPIHIYTVDAIKKLPAGLVLDRNTGQITGTPEEIGTFTVEFNVESTPWNTKGQVTIIVSPFDVSFDGMSYTTAPEDFKNSLDGTEMPYDPTETYDAGSFN
jgi:hypothetical protein